MAGRSVMGICATGSAGAEQFKFHDPVGKTLWNRAQLLKEDA